jgi:hypothetical protein
MGFTKFNYLHRGVNSDSNNYMDSLITSTDSAMNTNNVDVVCQTYLDNFLTFSYSPSPRMWSAMIGLAVPVLCFASYKIWRWVKHISTPTEEQLYEYKYLDELDALLETKLDDMKNPEMADKDTIKVGRNIFPLEVFRSFKKNYRKKLLRKTDNEPVVKRVPIPAEEFNWTESFAEDKLPNDKWISMRYEPDTESFWWYCNSSTIPYKYLETVARKYVCKFNRLDVFIDIREELKKGIEENKKRNQTKENEGDTPSANEKKIYAKFRKYNKKAARTDPSLGGKRLIIKARANRYSYKGKMDDYNKLFDKNGDSRNGRDSVTGDCRKYDNVDNDTVKVENISWNDWKNDTFNEWK